MTLRTMDEYGVRKLLRKACNRAGGEVAFAKEHGLSLALVLDVLKGDYPPGHSIPKALGLMRITRYAKQPKGRVG